MKTSSASRAPREAEFTLDELRGDCARMAPHWAPPAKEAPRPVSPSRIHGVVVSAASARLARGMLDY
ncbi:hypothetical protein ACH4E8_12465 [Streptomyces sp. NPDC017979]|uniref:hypothetical protein n=1 Tax=Streptomyces sp. NPDC017979 TaxID=3365024 RepID=UPI0037B0CFF8